MKEVTLTKLSAVPFSEQQKKQYGYEALLKKLKINNPSASTITEESMKITSFIDYAQLAYNNHRGLILTPDLIWQTVAYEVSVFLKQHSDQYKHLFTKSEEKIEILVPDRGVEGNISFFIKEVQKYCPTDIATFTPEFSTSTNLSKLSINVSFLEAVEAHYNYGVFLCGIPKAKIFGTKNDWEKIRGSCAKISGLIPELGEYMDRVKSTVNRIEKADIDFLSDIFSTQKLGSGPQLQLNGWIKDLYIDNSVRNIVNYPTSVSSIQYKNISTGEVFRIHAGLLSCAEEEDYLIPQFGYVVDRKSD